MVEKKLDKNKEIWKDGQNGRGKEGCIKEIRKVEK
jgi:hypothetical protein